MPGGGRGRYEARDVTRSGVRLVECVWVPAGGPAGAALFAVTPERVPLVAAALDAWLHRALAPWPGTSPG